LTLEDGTDSLSQNVVRNCPLHNIPEEHRSHLYVLYIWACHIAWFGVDGWCIAGISFSEILYSFRLYL
jgi:hypothetical protein